jgi:ADP-ribosylglycohydrolase
VRIESREVVELHDRIVGCLGGVMYGDAMGLPLVGYHSAEEVRVACAEPLTAEEVPSAAVSQLKRLPWARNEVSDDTIQTLAVCGSLIRQRRFDLHDIYTRLSEIPPRYAKPTKSIGRLREHPDGDLVDTANLGNGAAARVSPVAIYFSEASPQVLASAAYRASRMTHGTRSAAGAAGAIAGFIAAAVRGLIVGACTAKALECAALTMEFGADDGMPSIVDEIESALRLGRDGYLRDRRYEGEWGFKAIECVPTAFSIIADLGAHLDMPTAVLQSITIGGDSDSCAAMVGAMAGAYSPASLPAVAVGRIETRNGLNIANIAKELWRLLLEPGELSRSPIQTPAHAV